MARIKWGNIALVLFALGGVSALGAFGVSQFVGGDADGDDKSDGNGSAAKESNGGLLAGLRGDKADTSAPLFSAKNPARLNLVEFHGHMGPVIANGGMTTQPGSCFAEKGLHVNIEFRNDIPPFGAALASGYTCNWRTTADWALEQPGLRNVTAPGQTTKQDARGIVLLDNTVGADQCISTDPTVRSVEDLPGHTVAFLQGTPSHALIVKAIQNSKLSPRAKQQIRFKEIAPEKGTPEVAAILASGDADVACLWDYDLSLVKKQLGITDSVVSTAQFSDLIYDMLICDATALDNPAYYNAFVDLTDCIMMANDENEANPKPTLDTLMQQEGYGLLAKNEGKQFVYDLMKGLDWTGVADNLRILGLAGSHNQYEAVYTDFGSIWRDLGMYARPDYLTVPARESFDYRFVKAAAERHQEAEKKAAEPVVEFTPEKRIEASKAGTAMTKPVYITFEMGSADLTARARKTLDDEVAPFIDQNSRAYFAIEGNTDSTGSRSVNTRLSKARADAVKRYLVEQWEYDADRFDVVGNGPDAPICNESDPTGEGYADLDACRTANRNVGISVLK